MLVRATVPMLIEAFRGTLAEGEYKQSKNQYLLPDGGVIWIGSADRPETLEGGQIRAAWLDEAGQMKYQAWVVIQARLGLKMGRVLLTTTPYAMNWLYTEFYKRYMENDKDYEVVQFYSIDNPLYPKEEYERARATLDPNLFEMRYQGHFRKMEGLCYPDFNAECIADDFPIPSDWQKAGGMDFGFNNPMVVLYGALGNDDNFYIYKEIYVKGSLLSDMAERMEKRVPTYPDPSGKQEIEELSALGVNTEKANNDVNMGIERVNARVKTRRLKVFRSCKNLIDEFETYHWMKDKDKPAKENDHCLDALRYMIMGIDADLGEPSWVYHAGMKKAEVEDADIREQAVEMIDKMGHVPLVIFARSIGLSEEATREKLAKCGLSEWKPGRFIYGKDFGSLEEKATKVVEKVEERPEEDESWVL